MTTALHSPSPGGKMGGFVTSKQCDLCDSKTPVKYCSECQFSLCSICAKGHQRIQATKDHPLLDVGLALGSVTCASYAKSGDSESGPVTCKEHPQEVLQLYCEQCVVLICKDCDHNHKGHSVQTLTDDVKIYQTICTQHIKSLLDKTHHLEEHNTLIEGVFRSYDEAINMVRGWEEELILLVQDCSRSLREDLKKAKGEWEKVANDDENGLDKMTEAVEARLSKLTSIRKVTDVDVFSLELAASQELLQNVNNFIDNILPMLTIPTMDDLLPNMSQSSAVKSEIEDFMAPDDSAKCTRTADSNTFKNADSSTHEDIKYPSPNFDTPRQISEINIRDPVSFNGYRINKSYTRDNRVMLHGSCRKDIRILNPENNAIDCHVSECDMFNVASLGRDKYVAVRSKKLHLLDSECKVINTQLKNEPCKGVSKLSNQTFALLQVAGTDNKPTANVSIVEIENSGFSVTTVKTFDVPEKMMYFDVDHDKTHVYICGDTHLYKIKLADWTTQHADLSKWVAHAWCMCVGGDYILVGDKRGKLHMFNRQLDYIKELLKIPAAVNDIAVINGYIVLTSTDNRVFLYK